MSLSTQLLLTEKNKSRINQVEMFQILPINKKSKLNLKTTPFVVIKWNNNPSNDY